MAARKSTAKKVETPEEESLLEKVTSENVEAIAKKIWLAGLGAYGRSFDELQSRYEKVSTKVTTDSQKLFEELVERGEKLQGDAEGKLTEGKSELEKRIDTLKDSLPSISVPGAQFTTLLNELNTKLDAIAKDLKGKS